MALIRCPECRKKISDQCENCPSCGYPIKANIENKVFDDDEKVLTQSKKPINKKLLVAIIPIMVVVVFAVCGIIGYNIMLPKAMATVEFDAAVAMVEEKNSILDAAIKKSEDLILEKQPLLDDTLIPMLETAISDAKVVKEQNLKTPSSVEDTIARTEELKKIDYTVALANLSEKHEAVVINAKRYQLVNHPTEAYIIHCLKKVSYVVDIAAASEDADPNGQLNKVGGYTAHVFFTSYLVNQSEVIGVSVLEKGTDAGGSIEVYSSIEDAMKRNTYLSTFDGNPLSSGSHIVVGTVIVRTSNKLTATQQKNLAEKIIAVLTYLPEVDVDNTEQTEIEDATSMSETVQNTSDSTTDYIETDDNKDDTPTTTLPVNRNQEAVSEAINQANLRFPTDRHAIQYILMNPSLQEGFDAFTESEAIYAIENANIDWKNHALHSAKAIINYNKDSDYAQNSLYFSIQNGGDCCSCTGYTEEEIQYAVQNCGINWKERVINDMESYWDDDYNRVVTLYDFVEYLLKLGYDDSTIGYAIDNTSGYYRGEAVENEQARVSLLLSYGYTREAIINWYSEIMDYSEAETLVDSVCEKQ